MNQKTLEEVAQKQWGNVHRTGVLAFIEGAKYQAEIMYSEEEVISILYEQLEALDFYGSDFKFADWFEKVKNK